MRIASLLSMSAVPPLLMLLAAGSAVIAGCGGSGSQRAQATSKDLTESRVDVGKGGKQVDDALAALSTLVGTPEGDRQKAYAAFSARVAEVRGLAKDIDAQSKELATSSGAYFSNWETDNARISDQSMRAASNERRNDLHRRYAEVTDGYQDAQRSLAPFVASLGDIERYLGNDLSTTGIGNVAPASTRARDEGAAVKRDLGAIQDRIDALQASMGAGKRS